MIPEGVDWATWRIVSSEHFNASLVEIENLWSLSDLLDAHLTLEMLERAGSNG